MNRLREVTAGGYAMLCVILRLVWHDGWWKTAPCWLLTTMSSGCFSWCSLLIPWKSKVTKTQSEVSNEYQIRWFKLLDNWIRLDANWGQAFPGTHFERCFASYTPLGHYMELFTSTIRRYSNAHKIVDHWFSEDCASFDPPAFFLK